MDAVQDAAWTTAIAAVVIVLGRGLIGYGARARMMVSNPSSHWGTAAR